MDNDIVRFGDGVSREVAERLMDFSKKLDAIERSNRELNAKVSGLEKGVIALDKEITQESTLTLAEASVFESEVRRKGTEILGGKSSAAYADVNLRKRVFRDIHNEVKRQVGLVDDLGRYRKYVFLQRKNLEIARHHVANYEPPVALANEILIANEE